MTPESIVKQHSRKNVVHEKKNSKWTKAQMARLIIRDLPIKSAKGIYMYFALVELNIRYRRGTSKRVVLVLV